MSLTKGQKSRAVWAFFVVLRPFLLQTGMPALCLDSQGRKGEQQGWHTTACHPSVVPQPCCPLGVCLALPHCPCLVLCHLTAVAEHPDPLIWADGFQLLSCEWLAKAPDTSS